MPATVSIPIDQLSAEIKRELDLVEQALRSESLKKKLSIVLVSGVKTHFQQGRGPGGEVWPAPRLRAGRPLLDTGRLAASIRGDVTAQGVRLSAAGVQANLMQFGGTVTARKRFLAVPLTPEARRVTSPRQMPGLHFEGRKGANKGILANADGEAVFALVPSVYVPPRPFLGVSEPTMGVVERLIGDEVVKILGG